MHIKIGTAPTSWGVWFPESDRQISWETCMDEMAEAGYSGIELGPWGYFPKEYNRLKDELQQRNLELVATTLMDDLTCDRTTNEMISLLDQMAAVQVQFESAKYVVLIDACYTDLVTGEFIRPQYLNDAEWKRFTTNIIKIRDYAKLNYDLEVVFHPHAQTHVETETQIERLLKDTDIQLCFDIGHHAYMGGDPVAFMRKHYKRISYLHLKNCDMRIREKMLQENWSFAKAVSEDIMVEPELGVIDMVKFLGVLEEVDFKGWVIVEQDMYPAPIDKPFPILKRTRRYLEKIGLA